MWSGCCWQCQIWLFVAVCVFKEFVVDGDGVTWNGTCVDGENSNYEYDGHVTMNVTSGGGDNNDKVVV